MYYKRQEAFRYSFDNPIYCTGQTFLSNGDHLMINDIFEGSIQNLSPNGLKFTTDANIDPVKVIQIRLIFILNQTEINIDGKIVWKKVFGSKFEYGFNGNGDDDTKKRIIEELKKYSKQMSENK
ncbi:MAG TPA: PilZ domain-containing protein [Chondromyces sp.]|nr:PilZ domain-containing protein [Chondromyces sp.]